MKDIEEMLKTLGMSSWEELFSDVPREVWKDGIDIESMDELTLYRYARRLADKNRDFFSMPSFLGAGVYLHYIPPAVLEIAGRSEFYTSYTPYQAEIRETVRDLNYAIDQHDDGGPAYEPIGCLGVLCGRRRGG